MTLLHLCTTVEWDDMRAAGERRPPSLAESGFVHLSTPAQVSLPANRLFADRRDIVLLVLDEKRIPHEICWEPGVPTDPESMTFPHAYGPLPLAAVTAVLPYPPDAAGRYGAPDLSAARPV